LKIHESFVGILLFPVSVHVCGVIASSYAHKENLIQAMVTGNKKMDKLKSIQPSKKKLMITCLLFLYFVVNYAI